MKNNQWRVYDINWKLAMPDTFDYAGIVHLKESEMYSNPSRFLFLVKGKKLSLYTGNSFPLKSDR